MKQERCWIGQGGVSFKVSLRVIWPVAGKARFEPPSRPRRKSQFFPFSALSADVILLDFTKDQYSYEIAAATRDGTAASKVEAFGRHSHSTFSRPSSTLYLLRQQQSQTKTTAIMADTHTASVEESNAARLPLGFRDQCSAYVSNRTHTHITFPNMAPRISDIERSHTLVTERHERSTSADKKICLPFGFGNDGAKTDC